MASKKAAFEADEDDGPPTKRPRLNDGAAAVPPPSLESVNDDCLLHILSFVPADDLNSIAICSKRYRKARADESLDQTRMGILTISEGSTFESLDASIAENGWNNDFGGRRTHLVIVGVENLLGTASHQTMLRNQIDGVTSLKLKCDPVPDYEDLDDDSSCLCFLFPNVAEIDFSSFRSSNPDAVKFYFIRVCANLSKFSWNDCHEMSAHCPGGTEFRNSKFLTELVLDNSLFTVPLEIQLDFLVETSRGPRGIYMFSACKTLERLSIKNAMCCSQIPRDVDSRGEIRPVSQEMLIKMVRCHPTLRWLRSDLSEENIAMLQQERPEVTFVTR